MMKSNLREISGDYEMTGLLRTNSPGNIRSGFPTKGKNNSLESDVESEKSEELQNNSSLPKAAVVYIEKDGKVLSVSRGKDMTNMNMPGGTVEDGEDPIEAAVRELWEETGLKADEIFPVYTAVNNGWLVTTYKVTSYHGKLSSSWEGVAAWEDPETLKSGAYGDYFKRMMTSLKGV